MDIEKNINKKTKKKVKNKDISTRVSFFKLLRFAEKSDIVIIIIMLISSAGVGLTQPLNVLVLKDIVNVLVNPNRYPSYMVALHPMVNRFSVLASATFICGFIQMICVTITAEHQGQRYKHNLFKAFLRQNISWFEEQKTDQLLKKINDDIETIEVTIADKFSFFIQQLASFVGAIIIGFYEGWDLAFVACTVIPFMVVSFYFMIRFSKKYLIAQGRAYTIAGTIAQEILCGIQTVMTFNAQEKEWKRYTSKLSSCEQFGIKRAICQGLGAGGIGLSTYLVASAVFYVGIRMVERFEYPGGIVVQMFLSIVLGSIVLGNAALILETFFTTQTLARPIFDILDKEPPICLQKNGIVPEYFDGNIIFKDVFFEYKPGIQALKNLNFTIPKGKTVAFIGKKKSGKSTIINLLQRFYDPTSGNIFINNNNLKEVDLNWYRSQVSVVNKEPTLFSGTLEENIRLGNIHEPYEDIEKAAKESDVWELISPMKNNFHTQVLDVDVKTDAGHMQSIAIAAALIRNSKLLLIDEATSELDADSEKHIQKCLENVIHSEKRTVVIVAHQLSFVRNADIIMVMSNGEIIEQGNHDELVGKKGLYFEMLQKQKDKEHKVEYEVSKSQIREERKNKQRSSQESINSQKEIIELSKSKPRFQSLNDFIRIIKMSSDKGCVFMIGLIASIFVGISFPIAAVIYAQMFRVFSSRNTTTVMIEQGNIFCGLLILPSLVLFVGQIIKSVCLAVVGEALTTSIRKKLFKAFLKQELAWFNKSENSTGALTTRLAQEVPLIKGMASIQLGVYVEVISTIVAFFIMGLYYSWMLAILFIIFIPFIIMAGVMQGKLSSNQRITWRDSVGSNALILQTLKQIKTVQSLGLEEHFSDQYLSILKSSEKGKKCKLFLYGLLNAVCTSSLSYAFSAIFFTGSVIIDEGYIEIINLTRVFAIVSISCVALGRTISLTPDIEKARRAARRTLEILDRNSSIDIEAIDVEYPCKKLSGKIEFKNIAFRYPTEINASILHNFSVKIKAREKVALVGREKFGRTTIVELLERFYDPLHGCVLFDGFDLKSLNLHSVRNQMVLVNQNSYLFNLTIAENIAYGFDGVRKQEDIENAARIANIHNYITTLPNGYNTKIGKDGLTFDEGQKQRLCIARAFYSQPSIWILDEATSALDFETRRIVQNALLKTQKNCTFIIIPNELSEIENADKIIVIENGTIEEIGTHDHLMNMEGIYYKLVIANIE